MWPPPCWAIRWTLRDSWTFKFCTFDVCITSASTPGNGARTVAQCSAFKCCLAGGVCGFFAFLSGRGLFRNSLRYICLWHFMATYGNTNCGWPQSVSPCTLLRLAGRVDLASRCLARDFIRVRHRTICLGCRTQETDPRLLGTGDGQGDCGPPHGVASSRAEGLGTFSESFLDCESHATWTCWKSCSRTNMNQTEWEVSCWMASVSARLCSLTQYITILPDIQGCQWEDPEDSRSEVPMSGLQQVLQRPRVCLQALASDSHKHLGRCSWRATPGNRSECIPCRSCPSSRACHDLVIHPNLVLLWALVRHTADAVNGDPFVSVAMNLEYCQLCRKFNVVCWPRLGNPSIILTYLDVNQMYVPWLLCCKYLEWFPSIGTMDPSACLERPQLITRS